MTHEPWKRETIRRLRTGPGIFIYIAIIWAVISTIQYHEDHFGGFPDFSTSCLNTINGC